MWLVLMDNLYSASFMKNHLDNIVFILLSLNSLLYIGNKSKFLLPFIYFFIFFNNACNTLNCVFFFNILCNN